MESCSLFEEIFKNVPNAGVVVNLANEVLAANNVALRLFPSLPDTKDILPFLDCSQKSFRKNNRFYEVSVQELQSLNVRLLWLSDVTKEKETLALLKCDRLELEEIVAEKVKHIQHMQQKVVESLSDIIETRDGNTGGHVKRTSFVVRILLSAMLRDDYPNVDWKFVEIVSGCSPLHDIGKIAVSDLVLKKNGRLTDDEFTTMKTHSAVGATLVERVLDSVEDPDVLAIAKNIVGYHHEKWDGTGYPSQLKGKQIPLEARVMAVADVYDALVSKRCYKEPMSFERAYGIMHESFGSHFDPSLEKYFEQCRSEIENFYSVDPECNGGITP